MNQEEFVQNFANQFDETDASEITIKTVFKDLDEWSSLLSLSVKFHKVVYDNLCK